MLLVRLSANEIFDMTTGLTYFHYEAGKPALEIWNSPAGPQANMVDVASGEYAIALWEFLEKSVIVEPPKEK